MLALLQRVTSARVEVAGEVLGAIDRGLLVFVCAEPADTPDVAGRLVDKILKLRVFGDTAGKMNLSVRDAAGGLLLVSQFTLAADTASGNRPGFAAAAPPQQAQMLYRHLLQYAHERHAPVAAGRFGADMQVHLVNDGPVTIPLSVR